MADLARRGFRSIRLDQLLKAPERTVLITFDDAYAHIATAVTPILTEYGFSAVMFAPGAYLGGRNEWDADQHPRLAALDIATPAQIRSMAEGPWEIASHGWRHIDLRTLQSEERRRELEGTRERLSEIAGKPVRALAYPFGLSDDAVRHDAKQAGYSLAFTASPGRFNDRYQLPRHQINGGDNLRVFRMKTSGWFDRLYRVQRLTPGWARARARAVVGRAAAR
ncbi:MAG: polysaccharide deacetylase family protein [Candidatus Dormibacteraeota bacterium]|nr:polysaccharide deacetylase family protein [Candidatus Dormibacteraeota bacterium]